MASTTIPTQSARLTVPLELIDAPTNERDLDPEHVKALVGSVRLQGVLVPLVVRPAGERFELVAGFHRLAAAAELGLPEIPVVIRDSEQEAADRAVENITSCRRRHDAIYADHGGMPTSTQHRPQSAVSGVRRSS